MLEIDSEPEPVDLGLPCFLRLALLGFTPATERLLDGDFPTQTPSAFLTESTQSSSQMTWSLLGWKNTISGSNTSNSLIPFSLEKVKPPQQGPAFHAGWGSLPPSGICALGKRGALYIDWGEGAARFYTLKY